MPRRQRTANVSLLAGKSKGVVVQNGREYLGDYLPLPLGQPDLLLRQAGVNGHLCQSSSSVPFLAPHPDQDVRHCIPRVVGTMDLLKLGNQTPEGSRSPRRPPQLVEQDFERVHIVDFYPLPA